MSTGHVYALIDPRDGAVRYVGLTKGPLAMRLNSHVSWPVNKRSREWITELKGLGLKPRIESLEVVDVSLLKEAERRWIRTMVLRGAQLTNKPADLVVYLPE